MKMKVICLLVMSFLIVSSFSVVGIHVENKLENEDQREERNYEHLCGLKVPDNWQEMASFDPCKPLNSASNPPSSFDWRDPQGRLGADWDCVTDVKDQDCGDCWAHAVVACLESAILIKDYVTEDLSEQYLISCNRDGYGCNGGWYNAHDYHQWKQGKHNYNDPNDNAVGAVREEGDGGFAYAHGDPAPCQGGYDQIYQINSWSYIGIFGSFTVPSTDSIKQAIYDHGPICASVWVGDAFHNYDGGIFGTNEESGDPLDPTNHAILIVGWNDNQGYWIIKNSWGTNWGESGFMRIKYGISNIGYAANYIKYPGSGQGVFSTEFEMQHITNHPDDGNFEEIDYWPYQEPEWYYGVKINSNLYSKHNRDYDNWFPINWIAAHRWSPNQIHHTNVEDVIIDVNIELWDWDSADPDDLADITPVSGRKFTGYYDLQRNELYSGTYPGGTKLTKTNGHYEIEGTQDDNARVEFDISDNCEISPDLESEGGPLSWTDVEPNDQRTGTIKVENAGDAKSMLNWEVTNYPDWVTISPTQGEDLTPEDGQVSLTVTATAPDELGETNSGTIKIKNLEYVSDIEEIDISISTVAQNRPPVISNPRPSDGATGQPTDITFKWDCTDADGDIVYFDFYLGLAEDNLMKMNSEPFNSEEFHMPSLSKSKRYYWRIIADDGEAETQGPIWEFRTEAESLRVDAGGPYQGRPNEDITFKATASGGISPYSYAWDFDNDGDFDDGTGRTATHSWSSEGYYSYIKVQVTDDTGNTATDTCSVDIDASRSKVNIKPLFFELIEKLFENNIIFKFFSLFSLK
jgi:hypothetical protein